MKLISHTQLLQNIQKLFDCSAFELHIKKNTENTLDLYIPYMMNDALECYLVLTNILLKGEYLNELSDCTTVELIDENDRPALLFRQGTENVFTVWFEKCFQSLRCYRYDQTGHFWRKGEEHWRRLVYIIGTIYDKYEYMGDEVCSPEEKELMTLMEFAPFRMYSPIRESLDDYYPETYAGLTCMRNYAKAVNDGSFLMLLSLYKHIPARFISPIIFRAMNHPKRSSLYNYIYEKMASASQKYPERCYFSELDTLIAKERQSIEEDLKSHGFVGTYPLFHRGNLQIFAAEEHPFTILEAEDYCFRIQFMVSETTASTHPLNYGFFRKHSNCGRVEKSLEFLG
ncbi:MAG: DUF3878 family protein [Ruminococcus sp.]|nr:DUF3878 family protein [Ruminococcus sp.]